MHKVYYSDILLDKQLLKENSGSPHVHNLFTSIFMSLKPKKQITN